MQYTIRRIPKTVDDAIRERARATGKSLNEAVVDALADGSGVKGARQKRRDLGDVAGSWNAEKSFESALADQDRIDMSCRRHQPSLTRTIRRHITTLHLPQLVRS